MCITQKNTARNAANEFQNSLCLFLFWSTRFNTFFQRLSSFFEYPLLQKSLSKLLLKTKTDLLFDKSEIQCFLFHLWFLSAGIKEVKCHFIFTKIVTIWSISWFRHAGIYSVDLWSLNDNENWTLVKDF